MSPDNLVATHTAGRSGVGSMLSGDTRIGGLALDCPEASGCRFVSAFIHQDQDCLPWLCLGIERGYALSGNSPPITGRFKSDQGLGSIAKHILQVGPICVLLECLSPYGDLITVNPACHEGNFIGRPDL